VSFNSFHLNPEILANVKALGYQTPTPIQKQSIPVIMEGKDVMGLAQTGTGKTAAFVLPMLQKLMAGPRGRLRALIIAPTRELAQQIHEAIVELGKGTGLTSVTLYGGVSINPQIQKLRRGADIVVACPGRLLDHVSQRTIRLNEIEMLVLDEADQMFDMGFLPNIRKILQLLPAKRQSLLFSATMPQDIRQLANDVLRHPVTVQVSNNAPVQSVTQALFPVAESHKTQLLIKLLRSTKDVKSVLVFTRTKHRAKRLTEQLEAEGFIAASLQGNLSQNKRQSTLNAFRAGKLNVLVATDIASRGIDIALISHVINYDIPGTVEAYTHRIGRTGRAAQLGDAFTLVTRDDMQKVRAIERVLNAPIERRTLADFDYKGAVEIEAAAPKRRGPASRTSSGGARRSTRPAETSTRENKSRDGARSERPTGNRRPSSSNGDGQRKRTPSAFSNRNREDRPVKAESGARRSGASPRAAAHGAAKRPERSTEFKPRENRGRDNQRSERPAADRRRSGSSPRDGAARSDRPFANRRREDNPRSGNRSERPTEGRRHEGSSPRPASRRPSSSGEGRRYEGSNPRPTSRRPSSSGEDRRHEGGSPRPASRRPSSSGENRRHEGSSPRPTSRRPGAATEGRRPSNNSRPVNNRPGRASENRPRNSSGAAKPRPAAGRKFGDDLPSGNRKPRYKEDE